MTVATILAENGMEVLAIDKKTGTGGSN